MLRGAGLVSRDLLGAHAARPGEVLRDPMAEGLPVAHWVVRTCTCYR